MLVKDFRKGVKRCVKMVQKSKKKNPKFNNLGRKLKAWKI